MSRPCHCQSECACTLSNCAVYCQYTGPVPILEKVLLRKDSREYDDALRMQNTYRVLCADINGQQPWQVVFYICVAIFGVWCGWYMHIFVAWWIAGTMLRYGWVDPEDFSECGSSEDEIEVEQIQTQLTKRAILTRRKLEMKGIVREMFDQSNFQSKAVQKIHKGLAKMHRKHKLILPKADPEFSDKQSEEQVEDAFLGEASASMEPPARRVAPSPPKSTLRIAAGGLPGGGGSPRGGSPRATGSSRGGASGGGDDDDNNVALPLPSDGDDDIAEEDWM